jgi:hypothetical protein
MCLWPEDEVAMLNVAGWRQGGMSKGSLVWMESGVINVSTT